MRTIARSKVNKKSKEASEEKLSSSYDTTRAETNTPKRLGKAKNPKQSGSDFKRENKIYS
jgi:hypothetical protein